MSTTVDKRKHHVMRAVSHKSVIGIIRDAIEAWRKPLHLNREAVADAVVEAHHAIGAVERTGIWIEPQTAGRPEGLRLKANADRIFRWLDDQDKDNNLLPVNFLPSMLAALPPDLRVDVANQILAPAGLVARHAGMPGDGEFDPMAHLRVLLKESAEAKQSVASVAQDDSPENARRTVQELDDLINAAKATRDALARKVVA